MKDRNQMKRKEPEGSRKNVTGQKQSKAPSIYETRTGSYKNQRMRKGTQINSAMMAMG